MSERRNVGDDENRPYMAGGGYPSEPRLSREDLGRRVCEVALKWSREQDDRPGATATWEELAPEFRELHMRVGEALFSLGMTWSPTPRPDSETQWGYRRVGEPDDLVRKGDESEARKAGLIEGFETVQRRAPGPWEVVDRG